MRRTEIERLLPAVFQRATTEGTPLLALLDVMESLHAPTERALVSLDEKLDPRRAPEAFLPLLCSWVNLELVVSSGLGRVRELISSAARLSRMRGTHQGLIELLEVATGIRGFSIDESVLTASGRIRAFHVRVRAPGPAQAHRALVEQIVEREKPAHVTYELSFDSP
jgi:phage tail-like protein